jgi:hypothetical protein
LQVRLMSIERLKRPTQTTDSAGEAKDFYQQAIASVQVAEQNAAILGEELISGWRALADLPITNAGRADLYKREAEKLELVLRTINQMREANP